MHRTQVQPIGTSPSLREAPGGPSTTSYPPFLRHGNPWHACYPCAESQNGPAAAGSALAVRANQVPYRAIAGHHSRIRRLAAEGLGMLHVRIVTSLHRLYPWPLSSNAGCLAVAAQANWIDGLFEYRDGGPHANRRCRRRNQARKRSTGKDTRQILPCRGTRKIPRHDKSPPLVEPGEFQTFAAEPNCVKPARESTWMASAGIRPVFCYPRRCLRFDCCYPAHRLNQARVGVGRIFSIAVLFVSVLGWFCACTVQSSSIVRSDTVPLADQGGIFHGTHRHTCGWYLSGCDSVGIPGRRAGAERSPGGRKRLHRL